jgi:hypothetical protein
MYGSSGAVHLGSFVRLGFAEATAPDRILTFTLYPTCHPSRPAAKCGSLTAQEPQTSPVEIKRKAFLHWVIIFTTGQRIQDNREEFAGTLKNSLPRKQKSPFRWLFSSF